METIECARARPNRLLVLGLGLVGAAVGLSACDGDILGGPCCSGSAEAGFSFEADATGRIQFRLEAINGIVLVVGAANTETVVIQGTRRVESNSANDAAENLDLLQVEVSETASEVVVRTDQPSNTGNRNFIVEYQITVPMRLFAFISNVNGNITIDAMEGGVEVVNVNGNVTLTDIVGEARVGLVNGNIDAEVTPPASGTIELTNVNGNVILDVPTDVSAQLEATLTNGTISVANLTVQNEVTTATSLTGTLGAGEGEIELRSVNGNINISGF